MKVSSEPIRTNAYATSLSIENDSHFAHPAKHIRELGIVAGMKVADFGSGGAYHALELAVAVGKAGRVYAIDVQKDLLRRLKSEAHKRGIDSVIDVIWSDLESKHGSKLKEKSIDLVLIANLLFQVPDKGLVLKEAARVLKPGGLCAVIDWDKSSALHAKNAPSKDEVISFAQQENLKLSREFDAGSHHYGLLFNKTSATV